jgi:hypothetical protein
MSPALFELRTLCALQRKVCRQCDTTGLALLATGLIRTPDPGRFVFDPPALNPPHKGEHTVTR